MDRFPTVIDVLVPEAVRAAKRALLRTFLEETARILAPFQGRPSWVSPRST